VTIGFVALVLIAIGVAVYATSQPGFFARYAHLQHNHTALASSVHKNVRCEQCHGSNNGLTMVAEFYAGLIGSPKDPVLFKFSPPKREACLACHRYDWSDDSKRTTKVPHPAHLRVITEPRDCVSCHKWTAHEEVYQQKHMSMPFSTVCASFECHVGTKPAKDCKNCHHVLQESLGAWRDVHPATVRVAGPNGCFENDACHTADQCRMCHTTGKRPDFKTLATQEGVKAIEQKHVLSDWMSQHGTVALADPSKCLICHVSEGECQDCHAKRPAFHGSTASWLTQHQPLAKANEKRCLTCHQKQWCDECHKQFKENK
jgi:hypothetical protein